MSTTKSTMSSNTSSVISCLDQLGKQARPTLTLGASQDKEQQQQQLSTMLQVQSAGHHNQEQHFLTSLQVHHQSNNNNILSCSSVCSTMLPSANGEFSDQTTNSNNGNAGNNNMHLFEVDFM
jgi:hypothetical protein